MKFSAKQDVEAPIAYVFSALSDFDAWERAAMRRGAEATRTDKLRKPGAGMTWSAMFPFRGKARQLELRLQKMIAPNSLGFTAHSTAAEAEVSVDLVEMSVRRTRMHLVVEATPRTLTARLFIQSLRLARARLDRKFSQRVAQMVADIEAKYREEAKV